MALSCHFWNRPNSWFCNLKRFLVNLLASLESGSRTTKLRSVQPWRNKLPRVPLEMLGSNLDLLDKLGCCWYWKFTKVLFCENFGETLLKFYELLVLSSFFLKSLCIGQTKIKLQRVTRETKCSVSSASPTARKCSAAPPAKASASKLNSPNVCYWTKSERNFKPSNLFWFLWHSNNCRVFCWFKMASAVTTDVRLELASTCHLRWLLFCHHFSES